MRHPTARVSEEVNRKCPPYKNTILQLLTADVPKNMPHNDRTEVVHQNKQASKAEFC